MENVIESTWQEPEGLSLEYKRDYGTARGDADISNFVNNPFLNSPVGILGLLRTEEVRDLLLVEVRIVGDDTPDTLVIG